MTADHPASDGLFAIERVIGKQIERKSWGAALPIKAPRPIPLRR